MGHFVYMADKQKYRQKKQNKSVVSARSIVHPIGRNEAYGEKLAPSVPNGKMRKTRNSENDAN